MPQIRFLRIIHNQTPVVQIEFAYNQTTTNKLKVAAKTRWRETTKNYRHVLQKDLTNLKTRLMIWKYKIIKLHISLHNQRHKIILVDI